MSGVERSKGKKKPLGEDDGDLVSCLEGRRGRLSGSDGRGDGLSRIEIAVKMATLLSSNVVLSRRTMIWCYIQNA